MISLSNNHDPVDQLVLTSANPLEATIELSLNLLKLDNILASYFFCL